ncbi:hypothetical protein [Mesorhizobium sp. M8A.F.Ca.ET.165.01.1.1]|uniref:hypothetical protein n=1 Tax=Mesorhizobium sp. M8A.F.Ca.ET.165.01.1.1 TaxID=2563960 RepID=UPI00109346E2|nr:hypothetical protein [Mesorhizobium sp. M8A.F.Ca.ET.165.01.1.1]TGT42784.1 lytic transglycosylase domain-containing protein [Mesorhizobium sp. M8A.F.Ca.ET.165.01.1.1]
MGYTEVDPNSIKLDGQEPSDRSGSGFVQVDPSSITLDKPQEQKTLAGTIGNGIKAGVIGGIQTIADLIDPTPMFGLPRVESPIKPDLTNTKAHAAAQIDEARSHYKDGLVGKSVGMLTETAANPLNYVLPGDGTAATGAKVASSFGEKVLAGAVAGGEQGFIQGLGKEDNRTVNTAVGAGLGAATGVISAGASKVIQKLKEPAAQSVAGDVLGSGDVASHAADVRQILQGQHDIASQAEDLAWNKVRQEVVGQELNNKAIRSLQDKLLETQSTLTNNDSAATVDRILTGINKFVSGDQRIPAPTVLGWRKALSRASAKDAGLRDSVGVLDSVLKENLNVASLPKAIGATTNRFAKFVDQEAVAKAIADSATPETVGRVLMRDTSQGADVFNQVMKAAGDQAEEAKGAMQQGIGYHLLSDGVVTYNKAGVPVISKNGVADNIFALRSQNKSLWSKLSPAQQQGLTELATNLKKSADGNIASNLVRVISNFLGPKATVVNKITGATEKLAPSQQIDLPKAIEMMKVRPSGQSGASSLKSFGLVGSGSAAAGTLAGNIEGGRRNYEASQVANDNAPPLQEQPELQPTADQAQAVSPTFIDKLIQTESGGKANARNPNSRAAGVGQYIPSTWLASVEKHAPELLVGRTKAQVLKLRDDPKVVKQVLNGDVQDYSAKLQANGMPVNDTTVYLSHFLGPTGAVKLLNAKVGTPVAKILDREAILANKKVLAGKRAEQVLAWAQTKMANQ